jgi:hypothetical protein
MRRIARLALISVCLCLSLLNAAVAQGDDDYLRGYVAAIVDRELNVSAEAVSVAGGVVTIRADLSEADAAKLRKVLADVEGIERIDVIPADTQPPRLDWFPESSKFTPLLADPRWPHFSLSYQYYFGDSDVDHVAAPTFGELFPLLHYSPQFGGMWETGIQAGVFAVFDLASESFDLINADYRVAVPLIYAWGDWAAMFRFYHQSSHLGDEYLLRETTATTASTSAMRASTSCSRASSARLSSVRRRRTVRADPPVRSRLAAIRRRVHRPRLDFGFGIGIGNDLN